MKKIILLIMAVVLVVLIISLLFILKGKEVKNTVPPPNNEGTYELTPPSDSTPTPGSQTQQSESSSYKTVWAIVRDTDKIELYSNLEEKSSSVDAMTQHSCVYLTSGSFYSQENEHIGLFITKGQVLNESAVNKTFNGYFSVDTDGKAYITDVAPTEPRIAIQSGPRLIKNGQFLDLNLENDENARRIIVATTKTGNVIYLAFYNKSNTLLGPKLEELKGILEDLEKNTTLDFKDALNLDGGAHSAFITNISRLTEISTIGSYFCIKP